ncbi:Metallo-dependent phosphatase-like protein, partial [Endogone sp. FLAS-F59071]
HIDPINGRPWPIALIIARRKKSHTSAQDIPLPYLNLSYAGQTRKTLYHVCPPSYHMGITHEVALMASTQDATILTSFQYVSDIHLEYYRPKPQTWPSIPRLCPTLILAGDIGNAHHTHYRDFVSSCSTSFDHVLVVAGNHEFYQPSTPVLTAAEVLETIQSICDALPNVTFLNKKSVVIDNVRFLGATMWTQIRPEDKQTVASSMNDYYQIFIERPDPNSKPRSRSNKKKSGWRTATTEITQSWHRDQRDWLAHELTDPSDGLALPTVVVTHHAPSFRHLESIHSAEEGFQSAYATDLTKLMRNPPVVAWVSGHTHSITEMLLGEGRVLCVSNCSGYPKERVKGFDASKKVLIKKDENSGIVVAEQG